MRRHRAESVASKRHRHKAFLAQNTEALQEYALQQYLGEGRGCLFMSKQIPSAEDQTEVRYFTAKEVGEFAPDGAARRDVLRLIETYEPTDEVVLVIEEGPGDIYAYRFARIEEVI